MTIALTLSNQQHLPHQSQEQDLAITQFARLHPVFAELDLI